MTVATGKRVSRNTHAPLTLPGILSTAGHWDQSRGAIFLPSFHRFLPRFVGGVTHGVNLRSYANEEATRQTPGSRRLTSGRDRAHPRPRTPAQALQRSPAHQHGVGI